MKRIFRRRWLYLALIPFAIVASVYVWLLMTSAGSGPITKANYRKIEIGMTLNEVFYLLNPEKTYASGLGDSTGATWICIRERHSTEEYSEFEEFPPACEIRVIVGGKDNRVLRKSYYHPSASEIYDRLVYCLKCAISR
jgi:hypothetical protein